MAKVEQDIKECCNCKHYFLSPIDKMPGCRMYQETIHSLRYEGGIFRNREYCSYYEFIGSNQGTSNDKPVE